MSAGVNRARACALGILGAQRVAQPAPVTAAGLTALRSDLEERFDERLTGVTAFDDPHVFVKKTQTTPRNVIATALKRLETQA